MIRVDSPSHYSRRFDRPSNALDFNGIELLMPSSLGPGPRVLQNNFALLICLHIYSLEGCALRANVAARRQIFQPPELRPPLKQTRSIGRKQVFRQRISPGTFFTVKPEGTSKFGSSKPCPAVL